MNNFGHPEISHGGVRSQRARKNKSFSSTLLQVGFFLLHCQRCSHIFYALCHWLRIGIRREHYMPLTNRKCFSPSLPWSLPPFFLSTFLKKFSWSSSYSRQGYTRTRALSSKISFSRCKRFLYKTMHARRKDGCAGHEKHRGGRGHELILPEEGLSSTNASRWGVIQAMLSSYEAKFTKE